MQHRSHISRFVALTYICIMLLLNSICANGRELFSAKSQDTPHLICPGIIPRDTVALGSLRLCHSKFQGRKELYACQTVSSVSGKYRIYFKGGRQPKAVAWIQDHSDAEKLLQQKAQNFEPAFCNLGVPDKIPAASSFLGAGVCQDNSDRSIPCTVFRHKTPRTRTYSDYMVFYDPDGNGPTETKIIYTGVNHDAIPAELEFQIGLSLLKTRCCKQRGLKYVEHAYRLFPLSELYRTAYYRYKAQLSGNGPHQLSAK